MQYNKDLQSDHKDLFLQVRAFLLGHNGMQETKKSRITTYSNPRGGICHLRTMPQGIDIGFLKGAKMEDELGLLQGDGRAMRVLPLKEFNQEVIEYYLNQAIDINRSR